MEIDLFLENGDLILSIADNGEGFDESKVPMLEPSHFGLGTMRERAEEIGGHLDLSSHMGQGTEVKITIDMTSQPEEF